ncbi:hypothetical protein [Zavarzinella formosa]|uniref:hypothetical protein n=1 Tax=Zavarzinella formosa TaxID=360055 RepID=UPI000312E66F|nr:hypothetical protein [Zavarzinella formosa]
MQTDAIAGAILGCAIGDADTMAAIVGTIIGSGVGRQGLPADWLAGIREWPRSVPWMERLAETAMTAIRESRLVRPPEAWLPVTLPRNLLFLGLVLAHGFGRMLPPY